MSEASAARGAMCISIDLELAWGFRDRLTSDYLRNCLALERVIVTRLLEMFEEYDVCATWAIVGHLLRPRRDVPAGTLPAWYAPDMVDAIRRARPQHELGSHSFAHPCYTELSPAAAAEDLDAAAATHREHGLPFATFVFPRNRVAHTALLAKAGVRVCRTVDRGWHVRVANIDARLGRIANLADKMLPVPAQTVLPRRGSDLTEIESSMLLIGREGPRRLVPPAVLVTKANLALRAAAREGRVFHLWFHPSNFYCEADTQFGILRRILDQARELVRRGQLRIESMGALAA